MENQKVFRDLHLQNPNWISFGWDIKLAVPCCTSIYCLCWMSKSSHTWGKSVQNMCCRLLLSYHITNQVIKLWTIVSGKNLPASTAFPFLPSYKKYRKYGKRSIYCLQTITVVSGGPIEWETYLMEGIQHCSIAEFNRRTWTTRHYPIACGTPLCGLSLLCQYHWILGFQLGFVSIVTLFTRAAVKKYFGREVL